MPDFDPYRKWLGIPRKHQPPNHYRLLGIELFESDHDVIDAHANKQMAYLQGCATGEHADLAEKILDEMASARLCLLNPEKKAEYDAALKEKVEGEKQGVAGKSVSPVGQPAVSAQVQQLPVAEKLARPATPQGNSPRVPAVQQGNSLTTRTGRKNTNNHTTIIVAGSIAAAVVVLGIVVAILNSGKSDSVADNTGSDSTTPTSKSQPTEKQPGRAASDKPTDKADLTSTEARPTPGETAGPAGELADKNSSTRIPPDAASSETDKQELDESGATVSDSTNLQNNNDGDNKTDNPGNEQPVPTPVGEQNDDTSAATIANSPDQEPPASRLLPIPDADAQAAARKLVEDAYSAEYKSATSNKQKSELAAKMLQQANNINDDVTSRFALLDVASRIALDAKDVETALLATTELERAYRLDGLARKASIIESIAKSAKDPSENKLLAESCLSVIPEALAADRFTLAVDLARHARDAGRKARDPELLAQAVVQVKEAEAIAKAYAEVMTALGQVEKAVEDPLANLSAGRFFCFVLGQWERGLPLLAEGSDTTLERLAVADLSNPTEANQRVSIGDGWWELGESFDELPQRHLRQRAEFWYQMAVSDLPDGLVRTKVENRLETIQRASQSTRVAGGTNRAVDSKTERRKKPAYNHVFDFQKPEHLKNFFEVGGKMWRVQKDGLYLHGPRGSWVVTRHQFKGDFAFQLACQLGKYGEAKIFCCGEQFELKGNTGPQKLKVAIERRGDTLIFAKNGRPTVRKLKEEQLDKPTRIRINYDHWDTRQSYLLIRGIGITANEASLP